MSQLAIVTGASGQDGSYLAEYLISLGYKVIGVVRRTSTHNYWRLKNVLNSPSFILDEGDVTDPSYLFNLLNKYKPDEFYNLAAQSHVYTSFFQPSLTWNSVALGTLNCLEAIRILSPKTKFYQASSSEMFGDRIEHNGQKENTGFNPQSPYAIAKLAAHHSTELYRKSYNIYACSGILNNHESPRRGDNFVTKKITNYLKGEMKFLLELGNLDAYRDWSHAKDMVRGMHLMMQQPEPDTYAIGSGKSYSVKDFLEIAFSKKNLNWKDYVTINENLKRPSEVPYLRCLSTKLNNLGWKQDFTFDMLVEDMLYNEI